ncbi:MAG: serine/threonine protein kinase [Planctomycetes bacterium]|nr:serine/threonine protein kinase [Planctomycetota bacterium]
MTDARTCPNCQSIVPPESPGGACPRCLMALAFATDPGAAPPPDVPADQVQRRFPAYDVVGTIGRGGMGVVFRARQRALDREVALKVLPGGPSRPSGFTERFEREARALARLQHPGIVQVFDFGTSSDGWCYLAMELVEGTNLRSALAERRLAPKEALAIVPQICDALQYAHDHGVVHRDVKPENVLLSKDGRVKIADFGLAKLVEDARGASLTQTGHSMGTPMYMAPEQIERPGDVDHRADIYSLGVVFYEMLTGELPIGRFAAPSAKSDVDARIDAIVLRTLEKERSARFQRVADVKTRIDEAGGPPPVPPTLPPTLPSSVPAATRAAGAVAAAADRTFSLQRALFARPGPESRLSKLALLMTVGVVVGWFVVVSNEHSLTQTLWFTVPMLVGLLLCSLFAWGRIRHSGGTLHGIGFAGVGVVGAVLLVPVTVFALFSGAQARGSYGSYDATELAQRTTALSQERDRAAIRRLVDRTLALRPVTDRATLATLYIPDDFAEIEKIEQMGDDAFTQRAAAGLLGLPFAPDEFFGPGTTVADYRVQDAMLQGDTATVVMWADEVAVTIALVRAPAIAETAPNGWPVNHAASASDWRFALAPLRKSAMAMNPPGNPIPGQRPDGPDRGPAPPKPPRTPK